jgi:predicted TIM-barrel fold metal-dependent hydrolase
MLSNLTQEWSIEAHLQMADRMNITKSYLSISSPGVHLVPGDDELARRICRECNTAGADAKTRYPDRFGFWASLPLPDVDSSLEELAYAFDELDADGVVVETNVHGYYLGHRKNEPVWAELNRRHAIVFLHPTTPCSLQHQATGPAGCHKAAPLPEFANPIFEFFFDTARAVINLFYSGTIARYPNITYIIPHAGGCLPPLIERFSRFGRAIVGSAVDESVTPDFVKEKLKRNFYFDMAGTAWPDQVPALLAYVERNQVLYGSDYPFTPVEYVEQLGQVMQRFMPRVFETEEERRDAYKGNAERLFRDQIAAALVSTSSST